MGGSLNLEILYLVSVGVGTVNKRLTIYFMDRVVSVTIVTEEERKRGGPTQKPQNPIQKKRSVFSGFVPTGVTVSGEG